MGFQASMGYKAACLGKLASLSAPSTYFFLLFLSSHSIAGWSNFSPTVGVYGILGVCACL